MKRRKHTAALVAPPILLTIPQVAAAQGVKHQALSAPRRDQFGLAYGVWLKEWHLLQRGVCD